MGCEGTPGELVLTPLDKEAFPVLRYRTHDLTYVITEPCECGRTHARMKKVRTRTDDMLIIRATNVFPSQVEDILASIKGVSTHYRIEVDNDSGMDRMVVMAELEPDAFSDSFEEMEAFRKNIAARLREGLLVAPDVKLVEPDGLERFYGKAKHVIDRRK